MAGGVKGVKAQTTTVVRREVSIDMTEEQLQQAVREWLVRHVPQFRGMAELRLVWGTCQGEPDGTCFVSATKETRR